MRRQNSTEGIRLLGLNSRVLIAGVTSVQHSIWYCIRNNCSGSKLFKLVYNPNNNCARCYPDKHTGINSIRKVYNSFIGLAIVNVNTFITVIF